MRRPCPCTVFFLFPIILPWEDQSLHIVLHVLHIDVNQFTRFLLEFESSPQGLDLQACKDQATDPMTVIYRY
jgi:hypothetical protein